MTRRGNTGSYEVTTVGGEQVQAFIPKPLPPDPPVALANSRQRTGLSFPTATKGIDKLMDLAIVKERTGAGASVWSPTNATWRF